MHVVEASSFQLETTDTFRPWIAALLNFSPDHLDRHADAAAYGRPSHASSPTRAPEDWAVLNADDAASRAIARDGRARRLMFAMDADLDEGVVIAGDAIVRRSEEGDRSSSRSHR